MPTTGLNTSATKRKRGRPPKDVSVQLDVKRHIIRTGVEVLTESPFSTSSLDSVLKRAGVPKGSFYYYFESKDAFGLAVLEQYDLYFEKLLRRTLSDVSLSPLDRLQSFVSSAAAGMKKYDYRRGCAVGNLAHEVSSLPEAFRHKLRLIFVKWEGLLAGCLRDAAACGQIDATVNIDIQSAFFWIGWEGAVIKARLEQSRTPLDMFLQGFLSGLTRTKSVS